MIPIAAPLRTTAAARHDDHTAARLFAGAVRRDPAAILQSHVDNLALMAVHRLQMNFLTDAAGLFCQMAGKTRKRLLPAGTIALDIQKHMQTIP